MKLFGPKSWSYGIHLLFKIANYISLFFGAIFGIQFLMAGLDYLGVSNPIASLNIAPNQFEIYYKLWTDGPLSLPIGGVSGFLTYVYSTLFGLLIYFFLTLILSRIFRSLSRESVFMDALVKNTNFLAWFLIILAFERIILSFFFQERILNDPTDIVTLFFTGIMIWFLSKVFEEGNRIQQEIDLTI